MRRLLLSSVALATLATLPAHAVVTQSHTLSVSGPFEDGASCGSPGILTRGAVGKASRTLGPADAGCASDPAGGSTATFEAIDKTDVGELGAIAETDVEGEFQATSSGEAHLSTSFLVTEVDDLAEFKKLQKAKEKAKAQAKAEKSKQEQVKKEAEQQQAKTKEEAAKAKEAEKKQVESAKKQEAAEAENAHQMAKQTHGEGSEQEQTAKALKELKKQEAAAAAKAHEAALKEKKAASKKLVDSQKLKSMAEAKAVRNEKAAMAETEKERAEHQKTADKHKKVLEREEHGSFSETGWFNVVVDGLISWSGAGQTAGGWLDVSFGSAMETVQLFSLGDDCGSDLDYLCLIAGSDAPPENFGPQTYEFEFAYDLDRKLSFDVTLRLMASEGVDLNFGNTAELSFTLAEGRDVVEVGGDSLRGVAINTIPVPPAALLLLSGFGVAAAVRRRAKG